MARFWKGALALIYPPQCPACGVPTGGTGGLCADCWRETTFLSGPGCPGCAVPVAEAGMACDHCRTRPRPWAGAVAAFAYEGAARTMVLALKHGDRPDLAPALAGWLAQAAAPAVRPGMVVVPVPLHPARLMRRRYNQAALIGARLAAGLGLAHRPAALRRTCNTPMQDHRSHADRFANQQDAMAVARGADLAGRPVLLVDDVMASGATLAAAAEALLAAGAGPLAVAVLARAVKAGRLEHRPELPEGED